MLPSPESSVSLKACRDLCLTWKKMPPLYLGTEAALPISSCLTMSPKVPYEKSSFSVCLRSFFPEPQFQVSVAGQGNITETLSCFPISPSLWDLGILSLSFYNQQDKANPLAGLPYQFSRQTWSCLNLSYESVIAEKG